jgi:hypothetical protein
MKTPNQIHPHPQPKPKPQAQAAGVADDLPTSRRDADPFLRSGASMYDEIASSPELVSAAAAYGGGGYGARRVPVLPELEAAAVAAAARGLLDQQAAAKPALATLARVWALAALRRSGWRASRAELVARASAARCAAARPLYGRDLVAAVTRGVHPVAACLAAVQRVTRAPDGVTQPPDRVAAMMVTPADFEPPSASAAAAAAEAAASPEGAFGRFGNNSAGCGGSAYAGLAGAEGIQWWTGLQPGEFWLFWAALGFGWVGFQLQERG